MSDANISVSRCDLPLVHTINHIDIIPNIECEIDIDKDVNIGHFIRFALSSLQWIGNENNIGVTKYNTLTTTSYWSLDEITIEELL